MIELENFLLNRKEDLELEDLNPKIWDNLSKEMTGQDIKSSYSINFNHFWVKLFMILLLIIFAFLIGSKCENEKIRKEIAVLRQDFDDKQRQLLFALLENDSPIQRLRAMKISESVNSFDHEIGLALFGRLKFDRNINVRLAALEAMNHFTISDEVLEELLKILEKEKNHGIQLALIELLKKQKNSKTNSSFMRLINDKDTPSYIKNEASNALNFY